MAGRLRAATAVVGLVLASVSGVAKASDCWSAQEISAAKVRDFQTMMMVAALRCRGVNPHALVSYNAFVQAQRANVSLINDQLKRHFNSSYGPIEGPRAYDRFTTSLANAYGADGAAVESCADFEELTDLAAQAPTENGLLELAEQRGVAPALPSHSCPFTVAAK